MTHLIPSLPTSNGPWTERTQVQGPRTRRPRGPPSFASPGHLHCISHGCPPSHPSIPPSLNNKHSLPEAREGQTKRLEGSSLSNQSLDPVTRSLASTHSPFTPFTPFQAKLNPPCSSIHIARLSCPFIQLFPSHPSVSVPVSSTSTL